MNAVLRSKLLRFRLLTVQLSFLIVGHTHEDIDSAFSRISRKLKASDVETLPDLIHLVEQCEILDSVYDIKSWILPELNELTGISKPLHFKLTKVSSAVKTFYRGGCRDSWIELNRNPMCQLPSGKPKRLTADFYKIDVPRSLKQIENIKSYFASIASYSFWKTFYSKIHNGENPVPEQICTWILDKLPQQEIQQEIVRSLPAEITSLLAKEKETPSMDAKMKKSATTKTPTASKAKRGNNRVKNTDKTSHKKEKSKRAHGLSKETSQRSTVIVLSNDQKKHIWLMIFYDLLGAFILFLCLFVMMSIMLGYVAYILEYYSAIWQTLLSLHISHMCAQVHLNDILSCSKTNIGENILPLVQVW